MPVTRISVEVIWSAKDGASRWIEELKFETIGPASSTGSPMTFMIRPSVAWPDRHGDRGAGVDHLLAAGQALGRVHGDGAHGVLAQVLGDLEDEPERLARALVGVGGLQRVQDRAAGGRRTRRRPPRR